MRLPTENLFTPGKIYDMEVDYSAGPSPGEGVTDTPDDLNATLSHEFDVAARDTKKKGPFVLLARPPKMKQRPSFDESMHTRCMSHSHVFVRH